MNFALVALTFSALAIFIGFYATYYIICWWKIKSNSSRKDVPFNSNTPLVSIIVPVYNELKVLGRRIENFKELDYPKDKLEIVFVDGGSTDGSVPLLERIAEERTLNIKNFFQGSRKGFNSAVREGFALTSGEVIFISGAETEYDSYALNMILRHFADSTIGAVTGKQKIKNLTDGYSPKLETAYRDLYDFIRQGESYIDSPFDLKGEISAARREIVKALVENPALYKKGCIDACFSFQGKLSGYRTVYEPKAIYYELSPKSIKDSFKQQTRRAATLIENMWAFKELILNKKFGAFGLLIMPAHFFMLVVLPYILLIASIGLIMLPLLYPFNLLFFTISIVCLLGILVSRKVKAFIKTQLALIVATLKLMRGTETQKFERLESARP
jgi:biofilm PGA synthesis N-glycosyltransferase PgaC